MIFNNKYTSLIWIFFIFGFTACTFPKREVSIGLPAVLISMQEVNNQKDSTGTIATVLKFNEDSTYSHFGYNYYAYGNYKWNTAKKMILLSPTTSKYSPLKQQFKIEKVNNNQYTIKKTLQTIDDFLVQKEGNEAVGVSSSSKNDPFNPAMNTWRIKPAESESKAAIKNRTIAYLKFLQTYYRFIKEKKLTTFSYGWFPTPIKMHYVNGVKMSYNNELDDWYDCFYNIDEGNEAYMLISGTFRKCNFKQTNSIVARNVDYLEQMINLIKNNN